MAKKFWRILPVLGLFIAISLIAFIPSQAQSKSGTVILLTADGPLTPSMAEYLDRGLKIAAQRNAETVIFQINTPGGSIDLMNRMVQSIRGSQIPVIVYVAPRGAMAGSAGTLITLAGHLAAMAPETIIGAASPVGSQGEDIGTTLETKVKEALKATARTLAERRGPTAIALAEDAIQNAKAASASEALQAGLIDIIANDLPDLLHQLDSRQVETSDGILILHTENAIVLPVPPSLIEQILQALTNPNVVFLLLSVGVQALLIELSSPGGWVPGFFGVICLALAGYGMGVLPVNWFGLAFLFTAFVLFILDIKAPTHGALTAAGVASFIVGALVLFNSPGTPQFQKVSIPLVVSMALITAALFAIILSFAIRVRKQPVVTGIEMMVGRTGFARSEIKPLKSGTVQVGGELWTADIDPTEAAIPKNSKIEVVAVNGVRLRVHKRE